MNLKSLSALAALVALAGSAQAAVYAGNSASGFGGVIGGSSLTITDNGTNVDFSLTTSGAFSNDALILYINSVAGGANNTSTYTDTADGGRTAISGLSGSGRTLVNFAAGFGADFAITLQPGIFSGTFDLSTPASFGFVQGNGLSGSGSGPFTFSIAKASLGLPGVGAYSFDFVGTLISTTAFRSNETIGTSVTANVDGNGNAGFTGTQTFSSSNTFAVPEPSGLSLLALTGLAFARRRR